MRQLAVLIALLAGCNVTSEDNPVPEEERPWPVEEVRGVRPAELPESCPVVDGATVEVEETEGGVALVFRSDREVAQLQQRARRLAATYATLDQRPSMWATHLPVDREREAEPPRDPEGRIEPLPRADVAYEALDDGARLVFTAADPATRDDLRRMLREHRDYFIQGLCMVPFSVTPPPAKQDGV